MSALRSSLLSSLSVASAACGEIPPSGLLAALGQQPDPRAPPRGPPPVTAVSDREGLLVCLDAADHDEADAKIGRGTVDFVGECAGMGHVQRP